MQVKIFGGLNISILEGELNSWLANFPSYKILKVTQSQCESKVEFSDSLVVISIWYEEKYVKGKIPKPKPGRFMKV